MESISPTVHVRIVFEDGRFDSCARKQKRTRCPSRAFPKPWQIWIGHALVGYSHPRYMSVHWFGTRVRSRDCDPHGWHKLTQTHAQLRSQLSSTAPVHRCSRLRTEKACVRCHLSSIQWPVGFFHHGEHCNQDSVHSTPQRQKRKSHLLRCLMARILSILFRSIQCKLNVRINKKAAWLQIESPESANGHYFWNFAGQISAQTWLPTEFGLRIHFEMCVSNEFVLKRVEHVHIHSAGNL